jgi:hypothetical protein
MCGTYSGPVWGEGNKCIQYLPGNLKTLEDQYVNEERILNWTLKKLGCENPKLILLNQNGTQEIKVMNLLIHRN